MLRIPISTVRLRDFFRNLLSRRGPAAGPDEPKLTGAPERLRLKTYSSETGAVYQYVYRGQQAEREGTTFVFSMTQNRKDWKRIAVRLDWEAVNHWQDRNARTLRGIDLYAIAKMSLFEEFDRDEANAARSLIRPDPGDITRVLARLGLL